MSQGELNDDYYRGYYDGYHKAREEFLPIPSPGTAIHDIFMQGFKHGVTKQKTTPQPSSPDQRIATVRFDGSSGSIGLHQLAEELKPLLDFLKVAEAYKPEEFPWANGPKEETELK